MHLIILPGNSKEYNEQWLYDSEKAYADMFDSVTTHLYKHWETGDETIDIDTEVEKLGKEAKDKDDLIIFAKSAGTVTTIKAIAEGKVSPKKCIFVGCPFGGFARAQGDFDGLFSKYNVPTLFIQQTNDMFFKYAELKEYIDGNTIKDYKLIEIPGNNHSYDNYEEIKGWMKDFIK